MGPRRRRSLVLLIIALVLIVSHLMFRDGGSDSADGTVYSRQAHVGPLRFSANNAPMPAFDWVGASNDGDDDDDHDTTSDDDNDDDDSDATDYNTEPDDDVYDRTKEDSDEEVTVEDDDYIEDSSEDEEQYESEGEEDEEDEESEQERNEDEEQDSVQGHAEEERKNQNQEEAKAVGEAEGDTHQSRLVVVAYMRTGSSMTGRILQASPDVFYWYEPLHNLERYYVTGGNISSGYRNRTLNEYFKMSAMAGGNVSATLSCDIAHVYHLTLLDGFMGLGRYGTKVFHPCFKEAQTARQWSYCAANMTQFCRRNFKATAVKTIRLHMARAVEAMRRDPKIKIVHLVRDPRAVLLSRRELGFADFKKLPAEASLLCGKFLDDLKHVPPRSDPLRDRYMLVRYEDIAAGPLEHTLQLYKFMGLVPSEHVLDAVKGMMEQAKKTRKCPTCPPTPLNSTEVSQAWRQKMKFQDAVAISSQCTEVAKLLGYRPTFDSEEQLRDLRVSAVGPVVWS